MHRREAVDSGRGPEAKGPKLKTRSPTPVRAAADHCPLRAPLAHHLARHQRRGDGRQALSTAGKT